MFPSYVFRCPWLPKLPRLRASSCGARAAVSPGCFLCFPFENAKAMGVCVRAPGSLRMRPPRVPGGSAAWFLSPKSPRIRKCTESIFSKFRNMDPATKSQPPDCGIASVSSREYVCWRYQPTKLQNLIEIEGKCVRNSI